MKKLLPFFAACLLSCAALAQTEIEKARQIFAKALSESNPIKRKEAVEALSLIGADNIAYEQLGNALNDKDVDVQMAACASLATIKGKRSITLLQQAMKSEVPEVSFAAAKALFELNDPSGKAALLDILAGEKKTNSNYFTTQKRDALQMMKNPPALYRLAIREGVGMIPLPGAGFGAASLEGILKDSGVTGRALAATYLAREKDQASLQALREALTDKNWSVRAAAVHALALRQSTIALSEIAVLLEDKNEAVKYRAAAAYLRLAALPQVKGKANKILLPKRATK